jgi:hypothetical protein
MSAIATRLPESRRSADHQTRPFLMRKSKVLHQA